MVGGACFSMDKEATMNKQNKMPLWVALAFSNIGSRKVALYLVYGCAIFTAYCFPWPRYFTATDPLQEYLVDDWSWFALSLATTLWYGLGLKWIDNNCGWAESA
jgi:hypothetical protein